MKNNPLVSIALFTLLLCSLISTANATIVRTLSEEDLVNHAETILRGTVTSVRSEWNEERTKIFTYITITPGNFLKKDGTPKEIVIKQPGGEVDDIGMLVEGTSFFEEGEEALLFLEKGSGGYYKVLGLSQGKFSLGTDPISRREILVKKKVRMIRTPEGKITKQVLEVRSDKKLFLDEFTDRIQNILQQQGNK